MAKTPLWLQEQTWFKDMPIEFETVPAAMERQRQQGKEGRETMQISAERLRRRTAEALRDGFYPIIVGGDHTQTIGTISASKNYYKDARILWIDAHINSSLKNTDDANPLAYLTGMLKDSQDFACIDIKKDFIGFGDCSKDNKKVCQLADGHAVVFKAGMCNEGSAQDIDEFLRNRYKDQLNKLHKYWISFNVGAVCNEEF